MNEETRIMNVHLHRICMQCGYEDGSDRLYLRLPTLLRHVIDSDSPLAAWLEPGGMDADIRSEICVVVNGYMNYDNSNVLRQRTYTVDHHVKYGYGFVPIVRHPALSRDRKPRVRWQHFHVFTAAQGMEKFPPPPSFAQNRLPGGAMGPTTAHSGLIVAPESHGNMRAFDMRKGIYHESTTLNEIPESAPANVPLPQLKRPTLAEMRNDFTIVPADLQRCSAENELTNYSCMCRANRSTGITCTLLFRSADMRLKLAAMHQESPAAWGALFAFLPHQRTGQGSKLRFQIALRSFQKLDSCTSVNFVSRAI
jgi:hypothetical protein